jgi:hypothetical protein
MNIMMTHVLFLFFFFFSIAVATASSIDSSSACSAESQTCRVDVAEQTIEDEEFDSECDVYMAPSTIPGAGLGIFTGRALQPGDFVTGDVEGGGDVLIPVIDVKYHLLNSDSDKKYTKEFTSDYVWAGT